MSQEKIENITNVRALEINIAKIIEQHPKAKIVNLLYVIEEDGELYVKGMEILEEQTEEPPVML